MSENTNTTAASIDDTVLQALTELGYSAAEFGGIINTVVGKLTEREYAIVENIVNEAEVQYGYGERAEALVTAAGLSVRPVVVPEPEVAEPAAEEEPADTSTEARLARMEAAINALVGLANSRFGANL